LPVRLLDVSLLGRFAPLDVSLYLDVSPPVSKLVICATVTTSANYFFIFNKRGLLNPKFKHACHCLANGIGFLHERERAAYATFLQQKLNALLQSTIWQLWSIKITENSYL